MATTHSDTKPKPIDILIVGAGIAGTALASFLLLAQVNSPSELRFHITLLERAPSIQGYGQNIDIRGPGKELLKKLGVDDEVRAATTGEEGAKFVDSKGKIWASFGVDRSGEIETPTGEIEILRGRLSQILFKRCSVLSEQVKKMGGDGVEFVFGDIVDNIQQHDEAINETKRGIELNVGVHFAKGQKWKTFDVVVGSDGLQSRTRVLAWTTPHYDADEEQPSNDKEVSTTDNSLRQRVPFKDASDATISEHTRQQQCRLDNIQRSAINPSLQTNLQANNDPYLRPLGVYNAFFSIPASLLSRSEDQSSKTEDVTDATNVNDDVTDGWRRWYHAPGRKSVMLRPSDDSSRLTVLMIVLDQEHKDPRLSSAATVKANRKTAVSEQKQLMSEYFQDAGWECARLVEGMQAADDFYYDIVAQVKMDQWSKGRVCLLGDAAHCASPFSGMGTTLALVGAYNLAGALDKQMSPLARRRGSSPPAPVAEDLHSAISALTLEAAFSEYESATRPIVTKAQKLPPGMPWLIHPLTEWGVWVMHRIVGAIYLSGLDKTLARLAGRFKGKSKEDGLKEW